MASLTGQSWCVLKSGYTGGGTEQGFQHHFTDKLKQSLVSSVTQANLSSRGKLSDVMVR